MKRFFLFSVSCLILAVACLVFSQTFGSYANAQTENHQIAAMAAYYNSMNNRGYLYVMTTEGDLYLSTDSGASYQGNFWGSTVSAEKSSLSGVKTLYR
ncbi:MAG: hypothetical protein QG642_361 [Patescibacteria group bacterium]|nr:hypothetical protein [Patescibacteria group bacterium]